MREKIEKLIEKRKETQKMRELIHRKEFNGEELTEEEKAFSIEDDKKAKRTDIIFYSVIILICLVVVLLRFVFHPVVVVGDSMLPTYEDGNILKTTTNIEGHGLTYGDVVVFKRDGEDNRHLIKRIVGLPGDKLFFVNGQLVRNGEVIEEPYELMTDGGKLTEYIILGEDEYFVLGDNRNNSRDSRIFGPVHLDEITRVVTGRFGS